MFASYYDKNDFQVSLPYLPCLLFLIFPFWVKKKKKEDSFDEECLTVGLQKILRSGSQGFGGALSWWDVTRTETAADFYLALYFPYALAFRCDILDFLSAGSVGTSGCLLGLSGKIPLSSRTWGWGPVRG